MLGLQEVMERNRQRWREAVALAEPEPIKKKEFTSKCGLPRLDNYDVSEYPKEYWEKWPKYGLENLPNKSWIMPEKVTQLCEEAGIDVKGPIAAPVIQDLKFGANIGAVGRSRLPSIGPNSKLALENGFRVQDALAVFCKKGVFLGPLSEDEANSLGKEGIKVHPITAREKPNGNLRLITDASYPHEENDDEKGPASLNKFIDPDLYPTNMQGIPEFLSQLRNLGKDCKLAKADLADAYKHLHVRPEDVPLQFIKWGDKYFCDLKLMFGSRSSAGLYDRLNGLLLLITVKLTGFPSNLALRYLDDVFCLNRDSEKLEDFMKCYHYVCAEVGAKLDDSGDPNKCCGPTNEACILGVIFNTSNWTWRLDNDKARKFWDRLRVATKEAATLTERQAFASSMSHIKCLLPEEHLGMFAELYKWQLGDYQMKEMHKKWWQLVIKRTMLGLPIPLEQGRMPGNAIQAWTDAAGPDSRFVGRGLGMYVQGDFGFLPWPAWYANEEFNVAHRLSYLEALGALWTILHLKEKVRGNTVVVNIDNIGVVYAFEKGHSMKCELLNNVLHTAKLVSAALGGRLVIRHIPRCSNAESTIADLLSRAEINQATKLMTRRNNLVQPSPGLVAGISRPYESGPKWAKELLIELEEEGVWLWAQDYLFDML